MNSNVNTKCQSELMTETAQILLSEMARCYELEEDDLLRRVLLQLPRLSEAELQNRRIVAKEIETVAQQLKKVKRKYKQILGHNEKSLTLKELSFNVIPSDLASVINRNFHYIGYNRLRSIRLGFTSDSCTGRHSIVSMITLSPFDLEHVSPFLPNGIKSNNVLVVSRVFAFAWAPKNCISFMMGQMFKWIRQNKPRTKLLLTYLNPNVCFSGTSYKASNWILFGLEPNLKYAYLDRKYITLRALKSKFHASDEGCLRTLLGERLEFSVRPLAPLKLYAYFLDKRMKPAQLKPIVFWKEPAIA